MSRSRALLAAACVAACGNDDLSGASSPNGTPDASVQLPDYGTSPCWGTPATTTLYSGETHELGEVAVTCRAETDRTLLYVADDLWQAPIDQAQVNAWLHRFELFTPENSFDPARGVLLNDETVFGELDRSVLPSGKLEIYVVDTSGAGEGYLCSWCDYHQLHLDGKLLAPFDSDKSLGIAAHETVHAIHRSYDADELFWIDETLAQAAMTVNGFFTDQLWLEAYRRNPNVDWGPGAADATSFHYGAGLLWGSFLWERGGAALLGAIVRTPADGWEGLDAALISTGMTSSAWQLYREYMVAAYLDRPDLGYGIQSFDYGALPATGGIAKGGSASGELSAYGLVYYTLDAEGTLQLSAGSDPDTAELVALAVAVTDAAVDVVDVTSGGTLVVPPGAQAFLALTARQSASYAVVVR